MENGDGDKGHSIFMKSIKFIGTAVALVMLLFLPGSRLFAQFYVTGESPARVKWRVIKGEHYKVIYPQEIDSLAQRYLWLLEGNREFVMAGLESDPKKIPVILHPYTTLNNGMVVWAPKRMELYTRPGADVTYPENWELQLSLHENRHVGQMSHFTKGVYKPLNWFLGEQITGLGVGIYASKWLLEGDAVVAETELSESGRGRSAEFLEYYRASFLSGDERPWRKWRYGCYKHYTPDIYTFGYVVNTMGRMRSDNYLLAGKELEMYVRKPYNPGIVGKASKELTGGYRPRDLFIEGIEHYREMWREDYDRRGEHTVPVEMAAKTSNYYYKYTSPVVVGRDSVICIKQSFENPQTLVMLSGDPAFLKEHRSGEKRLRPFSSLTSNIKLCGDYIYWTESVPDERWGKEFYNRLFKYDLKSGKVEKMSGKSSYNSPSINGVGEMLAVVEYPLEGGSNLVLLDAESGEVTASFVSPENGQLTESAWIGERIYATAITESGIGLYSIEPGGDAVWRVEICGQHHNIKSLNSTADLIYFESDRDGVNNIYTYNPSTKMLSRLTNSDFAAHDPFISGNRLYYSNLKPEGDRIVYINLPAESEGEILSDGVMESRYTYPMAEMLTSQANSYFRDKGILAEGEEITDKIVKEKPADVNYASKPYRKGSHLFKFHSWAPFYYNVDRIMSMSFDHFYEVAALGATVYSQNSLGTAVTMLGYSFREGHHAGHISFEYSGLYPVFKIAADYNTTDRYKFKIEIEDDEIVPVTTTNNVPLFELDALAYLPINLSSRGWQRGLIPQVEWSYENNAFYSYKTGGYANRQQLACALRYYQMRPVATAAIFPKWGFSFTLMGSTSPIGRENFGSLAAADSYFYLPGIARRQGLRLAASYQKQYMDNKLFYLGNLVSMPRGFDSDTYGKEYFKFSADYAIPINLKGFSLGWLAYFKRLQVIPFADVAYMKRNAGFKPMNSFGGDLLLDAVICHIDIPFSLGVRYARTNEKGGSNYIGFLSSISFY